MSDDLEEQRDPEEAEAEQQFERKVKQLFAALEHCLGTNLWEPALILTYSGIDAMAWLDRPADHEDVTPDDFIAWVNTYLLPESGLNCSAEDLYGARCGMLHSHTAESRRHRQLLIRKLFYHRMVDEKPLALVQIRMNEKFLPVSVNVDRLVFFFSEGVERFVARLNAEPDRERLVRERILKSYLAEVHPILPPRVARADSSSGKEDGD